MDKSRVLDGEGFRDLHSDNSDISDDSDVGWGYTIHG